MQRVWKKQLKPINGLIKKFRNTYKFCNNDINKFILLLKKRVYPYEYTDSWERFNKTTLPNKKVFYSELYFENITDETIYMIKRYLRNLKLKIQVNILIYMLKVIHYCLQVYLKILEILKYINLILPIFYLHQD